MSNYNSQLNNSGVRMNMMNSNNYNTQNANIYQFQNTNLNESVFFFNGYDTQLIARVSGLSDDSINKFRQISINLSGVETKACNMGCYLATIILGSIFIFPLFFICCSWWKKMVLPVYQISIDGYKICQKLFSGYNVSSITLNIIDSTFNRQKANILYEALLRAQNLRGFIFRNNAVGQGKQGTQLSSFRTNMTPFKSLNFSTNMIWGQQIV